MYNARCSAAQDGCVQWNVCRVMHHDKQEVSFHGNKLTSHSQYQLDRQMWFIKATRSTGALGLPFEASSLYIDMLMPSQETVC